MSRATLDATKPKVGQTIVWRFCGNKGWQRSYVHAHYANGKVIALTHGLAEELVGVADIEWYVA